MAADRLRIFAGGPQANALSETSDVIRHGLRLCFSS